MGSTDPLETSLLHENVDALEDEEVKNYLLWMDSFGPNRKKYFEDLGTSPSRPIPSIEQPPIMEEKSLLTHLRYTYLGTSSTLLVIISSLLSQIEEERLLRVLREHKGAIGWSLADIKGIRPSMCMHGIMLEDDNKPTIESQRRLNPTMKEVVKKEVLKWLDIGVIYPISDSIWISPIQVVPKKGGMPVIKNENSDLVPIRIVSGWRICDYKKLNKVTRKDHFSLPFIDKMLDRLIDHEFCCFLDGYSDYNQIAIAPKD